jgi:glycosyltransferase
MKTKMKISVVTVSYNSGETIVDTMESILNQSYKNIEYIVVDGLSKDNTVEKIKKYEKKFAANGRILKWISESDEGLYDAMNKGIKMTTGEVVGILNSDDFYKDSEVIEDVIKKFKSKEVDSVYSDLVFIDPAKENKVVRKWKSGEYIKGSFRKGWHPAHPTLFVKKKVYDEYGLFNLKYKLGADYEIMLRFFEKAKVTCAYLDRIIVNMRIGGESTKSVKNIIKNNKENYDAWKINGLKPSFLTFPMKISRKIVQLKLGG